MHSSLSKKLVRDLLRSKASFGAALMVVVLGVTLLGASYASYRNLLRSYQYSYEVLHFADFVSRIDDAPADLPEKARELPGADRVETRLVGDLPASLPGEDTSGLVARIISVPTDEHPLVNDVLVYEGSYLSGEPAEVLLESSFAQARDIHPGDYLQVVSQGALVDLRVRGLVRTAEYILPAKSTQDFLPSPSSFAVIYTDHGTAAQLLDPPAPYNEVAVELSTLADRAEAIGALTTLAASGVVSGTTVREDQPSNAALKLDLDGFRELSLTFPVLFFAAAGITLTILLGRMVRTQTPLIGLMRAIGYQPSSVVLHYTAFGLLIGVAGALVGSIIGFLLGGVVTRYYAGIINIPFLVIEPEWGALAAGALGAVVVGVLAALFPALRASRIRPAEAMRGEVGLATGRTVHLGARLPAPLRIALRDVLRSGLRSVYTAAGVAAAAAIMIVSVAFIDTMNNAMDHEFDDVAPHDVMVEFARPVPDAVIAEVQGMTGVSVAEPIIQAPVELRTNDSSFSTFLIGLPSDGRLWNLFDTQLRPVQPADGLLVASGLKGRLNVDVGDEIDVVVAGRASRLRVEGFVSQTMGSSAYMSLDVVQAILGDPGSISGVLIATEPGAEDTVVRQLETLSGVAGITIRSVTREAVEELMGLFYAFIGIMIAFAALLAFAMVFNTVTVSIMERRRELATMRMIGASLGLVGAIVTIENLLVSSVGLAVGIVLGRLLAVPAIASFNSETFSFTRTVVEPVTVVAVATGLLLLVLASGLPGIRHIGRMDLADVARERAG